MYRGCDCECIPRGATPGGPHCVFVEEHCSTVHAAGKALTAPGKVETTAGRRVTASGNKETTKFLVTLQRSSAPPLSFSISFLLSFIYLLSYSGVSLFFFIFITSTTSFILLYYFFYSDLLL